MPNHVSNRLTVSGNPQTVAELFAAIAGGDDRPCIDFDKIIPTPAMLRNTGCGSSIIDGIKVTSWWTDNGHKWNDPEKLPDRLLTEAEQAEIAATGYANWYDWSIANWGTKWNAYNQKRLSDKSIYFETAWAVPKPTVAALAAKYPYVEFKIEYADEDRGNNAGVIRIINGSVTDNSFPITQVLEDTELEGPEAVALWFSLNPNSDPKEYGYDPKTWEYVGNEDEAA